MTSLRPVPTEAVETDLGAVADRVSPCATTTCCETVYDWFVAEPDRLVLPVVDDQARPVGLVARNEFLQTLASHFGRSLYLRKPITALMDADPLIVEATVPLSILGDRILGEKPTAMIRGFIVSKNGVYHGVGTGLDVLKLSMKKIRQQSVDLTVAERGASRANQAKSRFLAAMSHELRTPLNAIIGFSELIRDQVMGPDAMDTYTDYAADIHNSGSHLLELINDVLDIAKIESGKIDLQRQDLIVQEEIGPLWRGFTLRAETKNLDLRMHVPSEPIACFADPRALRQIVTNLVGNALKYTQNGGCVCLSVAAIEDQSVRIEVQDNGPGIPKSYQARIFEPFEQVDNSYQRHAEGSGLGLALTKELVAINGGTIGLDSTLGEGARFWIVLPQRKPVG